MLNVLVELESLRWNFIHLFCWCRVYKLEASAAKKTHFGVTANYGRECLLPSVPWVTASQTWFFFATIEWCVAPLYGGYALQYWNRLQQLTTNFFLGSCLTDSKNETHGVMECQRERKRVFQVWKTETELLQGQKGNPYRLPPEHASLEVYLALSQCCWSRFMLIRIWKSSSAVG